MNITWFNENQKSLISTIHDNNITLNKTCINVVENAYRVMLGLDYDEKAVYIKPLSKDEATRGDIKENHQYKITVKSSYARVSNKSFVNEIKKALGITDLSNPKKFISEYDEKSRTLKINLKEEVSL